MKVEHQIIHRLVDDGFTYEIGPDGDALGLVEIRYIEGDDVVARITFDTHYLPALAEIFTSLAKGQK